MTDYYIAEILSWMKERGATPLALKCMATELRREGVEQFGLKRTRWEAKQLRGIRERRRK